MRQFKFRKLEIMAMLWLSVVWSGSAYAEECIIDDGFLPDTADGFDTNGGATSDMTATVACGQSATAGGPGATAIGFEANATANSVAVGDRANASENKTAAFGALANASKPNATALGSEAKASADSAIAIGANAEAKQPGAIAIGAGTIANKANTMTVGVPVQVKRDDGTAQILINEKIAGNPVKTLFNVVCDTCTPGFRFSQTLPSNSTWNFRMAQSGAFTVDEPASSGKEAEFRLGGDLKIGGSLIEGSSRTIKKNIVEVDPSEVLAKLDKLPIHHWTYNHNPDRVRHMGPMAEDFYALFNLGETEKGISGVDTSGVALAAIKALNSNLVSEMSQKDRQIAELKLENDKEIAALQADLVAVKTQLAEMAGLKEILTRYMEQERTTGFSHVSF